MFMFEEFALGRSFSWSLNVELCRGLDWNRIRIRIGSGHSDYESRSGFSKMSGSETLVQGQITMGVLSQIAGALA